MYDTYSFFIKMLSEHTNVKMLPEVLAGAAEFRMINAPLNADRAKMEDMGRLHKRMKENAASSTSPSSSTPSCSRATSCCTRTSCA